MKKEKFIVFCLYLITYQLSGQSEIGVNIGFNNYLNFKTFSQDQFYPTSSGGFYDFGIYFNQFFKEDKGIKLYALSTAKTFNFLDNIDLTEIQQRDEFISIGALVMKEFTINDRMRIQTNSGLYVDLTHSRFFYFPPGQTIDSRYDDFAAQNYQKLGLMVDVPIIFDIRDNYTMSIGLRYGLDLLTFNSQPKHNQYQNFTFYLQAGYKFGNKSK